MTRRISTHPFNCGFTFCFVFKQFSVLILLKHSVGFGEHKSLFERGIPTSVYIVADIYIPVEFENSRIYAHFLPKGTTPSFALQFRGRRFVAHQQEARLVVDVSAGDLRVREIRARARETRGTRNARGESTITDDIQKQRSSVLQVSQHACARVFQPLLYLTLKFLKVTSLLEVACPKGRYKNRPLPRSYIIGFHTVLKGFLSTTAPCFFGLVLFETPFSRCNLKERLRQELLACKENLLKGRLFRDELR